MLFVYIVECRDKSYYTGVTNDLNRRVYEHNVGLSEVAYTFLRRPVRLIYFEAIDNNLAAIAREKQIKKWTRAKKEAMMAGNWDEVIELARSYKVRFGRTTRPAFR